MFLKAFSILCLSGVVLAASAESAAAIPVAAPSGSTIDTTPNWDGSTSINSFGPWATATYGETFLAPDDKLNSFTFYVDPQGSSFSTTAQVYAWSGSLFGGSGIGQATGPALYTSPSSIAVGGNGFQEIIVDTGGVALQVGQQYIALLTTSFLGDAEQEGGSVWGLTGWYNHPGVANDGGFVFYNNGVSPELLNTSTWDNFADFGSLAWKADFGKGAGSDAVPEPTAALLVLGGVAGLTVLRRRRSL